MNAMLSRAGKAVLSLACLALLLGLAACGGGGGEEGGAATATPGGGSVTPATGTATASGGPVEITLWHSEVASNLDTLQALTRRYNSSQSDVKVKLAFQGAEVNEFMAKLLASLGGEPPTMVYVTEGNAQRLIDSGAMTPVQAFVDQEKYDLSDLDKKSVDYYTLDGQLWAMPFAADIPLLYYNKLAFSEVGLDPEKPPKDLEELRQVSQKMVKRDSNGNLTRSGLAIDIDSWHLQVTLQEHGDLYVNNDNGRAGRATAVEFNGPTGQAFFQWWRDMVKEGLAINLGRNPTRAEGFLAIGSGRAAMTFGSAAALRSVVDVVESGLAQTQVALGVANRPGIPGGSGLPGIYGRALWILKSRPQAEQEAAWKFIKWLMEPEQQAEWYAGSGYLPVSISAFDLPPAKEMEAKYPQFKIAAQLYREASSAPGPLGPLLGPQLDVGQSVFRAVEEMLLQNKDPVKAINDAADDANGIVEEYNRRIQ